MLVFIITSFIYPVCFALRNFFFFLSVQNNIEKLLLEEGEEILLDFEKLQYIRQQKENTIPVVIQDYKTLEVLIIAYTNKEAFLYTLKHKVVALWSTSRNELWIKGKTSGNYLNLIEARINCEQNSLLYLVKMKTNTSCHTKDKNKNYRFTCFYRTIEDDRLKFRSL